MKCHTRGVVVALRYQQAIHLGLTYLYLSIRSLLQKSLKRSEREIERAKSGDG